MHCSTSVRNTRAPACFHEISSFFFPKMFQISIWFSGSITPACECFCSSFYKFKIMNVKSPPTTIHRGTVQNKKVGVKSHVYTYIYINTYLMQLYFNNRLLCCPEILQICLCLLYCTLDQAPVNMLLCPCQVVKFETSWTRL